MNVIKVGLLRCFTWIFPRGDGRAVRRIIAADVIPATEPLPRGALRLTYLGYFFIPETLWSRTHGKYLYLVD
jgi:hypothetical protein